MSVPQTVVVKIGGSTLGSGDTTLEDITALQREGYRVVVIHGGGKSITEWLTRINHSSRFADGVRVTDAVALEVAVAVMGGLINAQLVAGARALGANAVGLCGVDGGLLSLVPARPELGFVGEVSGVNCPLLGSLLHFGLLPIVAPIGADAAGQLYNMNGDTTAGEVAAAIEADWLVFLTDVPGLLDREGAVISTVTAESAAELRNDGTIGGGMVPKVEAALRAVRTGTVARIVDGRQPGALLTALRDATGTTIRE